EREESDELRGRAESVDDERRADDRVRFEDGAPVHDEPGARAGTDRAARWRAGARSAGNSGVVHDIDDREVGAVFSRRRFRSSESIESTPPRSPRTALRT